jgi:hypothetical protein
MGAKHCPDGDKCDLVMCPVCGTFGDGKKLYSRTPSSFFKTDDPGMI